jgi:hypothetical protein
MLFARMTAIVFANKCVCGNGWAASGRQSNLPSDGSPLELPPLSIDVGLLTSRRRDQEGRRSQRRYSNDPHARSNSRGPSDRTHEVSVTHDVFPLRFK